MSDELSLPAARLSTLQLSEVIGDELEGVIFEEINLNQTTMTEKKGAIEKASFELAVKVVNAMKVLVEEKREYVLSKQLLRSGTAVGALVREAQNAESDRDFIHKLAIAQKECDESIYWIDLLVATDYLTELQTAEIRSQAASILRMIKSAILTVKKRLK